MPTFFEDLRQTAEQSTAAERWRRILSQALVKYLQADNCGSPLGCRPDETAICDCKTPDPTQVATSQLLNLGLILEALKAN